MNVLIAGANGMLGRPCQEWDAPAPRRVYGALEAFLKSEFPG